MNYSDSLGITQLFFPQGRIRVKFLTKCFCFLCVSVLISFLLYIFQLRDSNRRLSMIHRYEKKLSSIYRENRGLEVNYSVLNYLENIEDQITSNLTFEEVKGIRYLRVLDGQMVQVDLEVSSR